MRFVLVIVTLLGIFEIHALEYGFNAKKESLVPIKKFHIYSERCSGSNYLQSLLVKNLSLQKDAFFGHKHFLPWLSLPLEEYRGPTHHYTFNGSEETVFLVIFRDPYDWVQSFYNMPWHAAPHIKELPFSTFIRTSWELDEKDPLVIEQRQFNPLMDQDPHGKCSFENVLKLRQEKIRNMLMMKDKVSNIYYINYEVLKEHPKEVIKEISRFFNIPSKFLFKNIKTYKGDKAKGVYQDKEYPLPSNDDLIYINSQLDETLEGNIHYALKRRD